jgi:hypothetical protein
MPLPERPCNTFTLLCTPLRTFLFRNRHLNPRRTRAPYPLLHPYPDSSVHRTQNGRKKEDNEEDSCLGGGVVRNLVAYRISLGQRPTSAAPRFPITTPVVLWIGCKIVEHEVRLSGFRGFTGSSAPLIEQWRHTNRMVHRLRTDGSMHQDPTTLRHLGSSELHSLVDMASAHSDPCC